MNIDDIVEIINSALLNDNTYGMVKSVKTYPTADYFQSLSVEDYCGNIFLIEVRKEDHKGQL